MANAHLVAVAMTAGKPKDAAMAVLPEAEVYVAGVIDKEAEVKKLSKRRGDLQKFLAGNRAKLGNEAFVGKAPAKVVQGLRDQLAQQEAELAAIEKNLAELGA
jgi:valyl-tRNA synthetase